MLDARDEFIDPRLWRACAGKRAFPSRKNATGFAIKLALMEMENARTPEEQRRAKRLHAYRCPRCRRWHAGHSGSDVAVNRRRLKAALVV